jgi:hypothetical protein
MRVISLLAERSISSSRTYLFHELAVTFSRYFKDKAVLEQNGTGVAQSVWLQTGRPSNRGSIPRQRQSIFPLASVSRPALRPTQPPIQWVPGVLSPGVKRGRSLTLTANSHLVPRSVMSRSCTFSPPCHLHGGSGTAFALEQSIVILWMV